MFDHPVIARCQLHKIRNVESKLPDDVARVVVKGGCAPPIATPTPWPPKGRSKRSPGASTQHPGAAASLRECLAETLTIARLGVAPTLARALRSTNTVESMIEICRDRSRNVKRCRDGAMVLAGVRPACSRRRGSFDASTGICTCGRYARRSTSTWRRPLHPVATVPTRRWPPSSSPRGRHSKSTPDGTSSDCGPSPMCVARKGRYFGLRLRLGWPGRYQLEQR